MSIWSTLQSVSTLLCASLESVRDRRSRLDLLPSAPGLNVLTPPTSAPGFSACRCEYSEYPFFTPVSRVSAAGSPGVAGAKGERGAPGEYSEYPMYPHGGLRVPRVPLCALNSEAGVSSVWVLGIPVMPECVGSPLRVVCEYSEWEPSLVTHVAPLSALMHMLRAVYLSPVCEYPIVPHDP